jgi:hypothetical protein
MQGYALFTNLEAPLSKGWTMPHALCGGHQCDCECVLVNSVCVATRTLSPTASRLERRPPEATRVTRWPPSCIATASGAATPNRFVARDSPRYNRERQTRRTQNRRRAQRNGRFGREIRKCRLQQQPAPPPPRPSSSALCPGGDAIAIFTVQGHRLAHEIQRMRQSWQAGWLRWSARTPRRRCESNRSSTS